MAKLNLPIHDAINKLKSEISLFLEDNRGFFLNQGKQLSSYFEMACYNHIVSYYKNSGWMIEIQNLQSDYFRYKLSTAGYPENFSYFQIYKEVNVGNNRRILVFEIHHNLCIQSFHNEDIYLVPDISVINFKSIVNDENHYLKGFNKKFSYVRNKDLQTFCEVKQFNPFPELLYSFMGLYYELVGNDKKQEHGHNEPEHIAPSLMISGKESQHTSRIKLHLEARGKLNIVFDVFQKGKFKFGKESLKDLCRIYSKNYNRLDNIEEISLSSSENKVLEDEELPF